MALWPRVPIQSLAGSLTISSFTTEPTLMVEQKSNYVDCPPSLKTAPESLDVLAALVKREPIFHHPEFGRTRRDFENMTVEEYWEVGASGRRYNREYVLDELVKRYQDPQYRGFILHPKTVGRQRTSNALKLLATTICLLTRSPKAHESLADPQSGGDAETIGKSSITREQL